jgi:GNAT superfamily N-acetyltransferase
MRVRETVSYLEMTDPAALRPGRGMAELEVRQARVPCPELNRFLYTAVGGGWYWVDRLGWPLDRWAEMLARPGFETWVGWRDGTPAGYFELDPTADGSIEIASFGLLPQFTGCGLGGGLLTAAASRGWQTGARRVWLHTSSLDHPHARANYLARGFLLYKEETFWKDLPDRPPGPWPGAEQT